MTTLTIVAVALLLPVSPLAHVLAFTVPPPAFLAFVATATAVYLLLVEAAKRLVLRRVGRRGSGVGQWRLEADRAAVGVVGLRRRELHREPLLRSGQSSARPRSVEATRSPRVSRW